MATAILLSLKPEVTVFWQECGAEDDILIGSDSMPWKQHPIQKKEYTSSTSICLRGKYTNIIVLVAFLGVPQ